MNMEEFFGVIGTLTAFVGVWPQVIKSFRTKTAKGVSILMLLNYLLGSFAWLMYGLLRKSPFLIFGNLSALIVGSILLSQKIYYSNKD